MNILSNLADFIFPRECHICGVALPRGDKYVCASCISRLPRTHFHRYPGNAMERRFMGQFPYQAVAGHFFYSRGSELASLIHDFKYRKFRGLARYLGQLMAKELITTSFLTDIDVILGIPMHFFKQARRGYNQTVELALGISDITGIPVGNNLKAVKSHRTQTSLTLEQRFANIDGIFRVQNPNQLAHKTILLLDDVCTTGATLATAARVLTDSCHDIKLSLLTLGVTF